MGGNMGARTITIANQVNGRPGRQRGTSHAGIFLLMQIDV
jgi:hypothetical protein